MASSGPSGDSQTDSQPVSTHGKILIQGPVNEGTGVYTFEFVLLHAGHENVFIEQFLVDF